MYSSALGTFWDVREPRCSMPHFSLSIENSPNTGTNNSGEAISASPELCLTASDSCLFRRDGHALNVHLVQADGAILLHQVVAQPDEQEDRKADVRGGNLQELTTEDGLVILAQQNDQAHGEGQDRTEGEEGRLVGKLVKGVSLLDVCPAETPVACRNAQPDDESREA